jgi:catechol 2,3-dioxygenase-like lactoylglutathione lyase family enzyme
MTVRRIMPVVRSADLERSRDFYVGFLGLEAGMDDPGFLMLRSTAVETTQIVVATVDAADPDVRRADVSVEVSDVEARFAEAVSRGLEIVYPLTDEPWGIRRFFVRDPDGLVINVASHRTLTPAMPRSPAPPSPGP